MPTVIDPAPALWLAAETAAERVEHAVDAVGVGVVDEMDAELVGLGAQRFSSGLDRHSSKSSRAGSSGGRSTGCTH